MKRGSKFKVQSSKGLNSLRPIADESRASVLECASPPELFRAGGEWKTLWSLMRAYHFSQSGRGLPHSMTLPRVRTRHSQGLSFEF